MTKIEEIRQEIAAMYPELNKEEKPWLSDEEAEILGKDMYKKQKTKERAKREREILLIAREKIKMLQKT